VDHKHLLVNATFKKTPFTNELFTESWIKNLVDIIEMQILYKPIAVRCEEKNNEGISAFCLITTSHIALHSWEKKDPNLVQLDVYSCKKFDQHLIENELKKFSPIRIGSHFLDRGLRCTRGWQLFDENML